MQASGKLYVKKKGCNVGHCTLRKPSWNGSGGKFLFKPGMFPSSLAQVIEFCPAHLGMSLDNHPFQAWGAGEKSAFYPDAIAGDAADGKAGVISTRPFTYDRASEFLDTFCVSFFDTDMHTNHIARV